MTIKPFIKIIFTVIATCISCCAGAEENSDFENMLSGFYKCEFEGVYLDLETGLPIHSYFIDRGLKPKKIEHYLAHYHVSENFHELPVSEIYIPADTLSAVIIVIDASLDLVEKKLHGYLKYGYNKEFVFGDESRETVLTPTLKVHKLNKKKTALMCVL